MINLPAPAPDKRDGVGQAVAAALGIDVRAVTLNGDALEIDAPDSARASAEAAVRAHTPPARPDPDGEFRAALAAATTVTQLRDALLGKAGPGAQARRPTST